MKTPNTQPFIITLEGGAHNGVRFYFPELRFAIKRACALTGESGAAKRTVISHVDTFDEETQLGVVVGGEYFPAQKRATFEDVERAIVQRSFAFHLLGRALNRVEAQGRSIGYRHGWDSTDSRAFDAAEEIIKDALERVGSEMSHSERTANYNVERLTEQ